MSEPIYLDYNATTPVDPIVIESILPYLFENFGNPSSSYSIGKSAKNAIEEARTNVANLLSCQSDEITFVSCATESINMAIRGAAFSQKKKFGIESPSVITCVTEHVAVLETCKYLEREGFRVVYLPVDEFGLICLKTLSEAVTEETVLVTIMHANNETGTIHDISEMVRLVKTKNSNVIFHTDARYLNLLFVLK